MRTLTDYRGRAIRLTEERQAHILEHPEMLGQEARIIETLIEPEFVVATPADAAVHIYGRFYETTPVTSKYLQVVAKLSPDDAFVLTAYYSSRLKRGRTIWPE